MAAWFLTNFAVNPFISIITEALITTVGIYTTSILTNSCCALVHIYGKEQHIVTSNFHSLTPPLTAVDPMDKATRRCRSYVDCHS